MELKIVAGTFAVCRLDAGESFPAWAMPSQGLLFLARTEDEVSVVCEERLVPTGVNCERGWSALRVAGKLEFSLTGILASLLKPLADVGVSVFAVSTFDTDYILVREIEPAVSALVACGYRCNK